MSERAMMTMRTGAHGERVSLLGYGAMRYPTVDGSHANTHHGGSNAAIDTAAVQRHIKNSGNLLLVSMSTI